MLYGSKAHDAWNLGAGGMMGQAGTELNQWIWSVIQEPTWHDIRRRFEDSSCSSGIGDECAQGLLDNAYLLRQFISTEYATFSKTSSAVPPMDIDFPGTRVQKDGVTYGIHGIVHDEQMRTLLLSTFSDIPEGTSVVLETSIKDRYPISGSHEQSRLSEYQFATDDILHVGDRSILVATIVGGNPGPKEKHMSDLIDDRTVAKWDDGRMTIDNLFLPDNLERTFPEFVLSDTGTPKKCHKAGILLRSLAQSYFMQEVAQRTGASQMHSFVGMAHEQDIAIFLRHPDIADELAAKYSPTGAYVPSAVFDRAVVSEQRVCHNLNHTYLRVLFPLISAASGGFFLALGAMQLQDDEPAGYALCALGIAAGAVTTWMYRTLGREFDQISVDLVNHKR